MSKTSGNPIETITGGVLKRGHTGAAVPLEGRLTKGRELPGYKHVVVPSIPVPFEAAIFSNDVFQTSPPSTVSFEAAIFQNDAFQTG